MRIRARASGRFFIREIVGCEHYAESLSGPRSGVILKPGSCRKVVASLASSYPAPSNPGRIGLPFQRCFHGQRRHPRGPRLVALETGQAHIEIPLLPTPDRGHPVLTACSCSLLQVDIPMVS